MTITETLARRNQHYPGAGFVPGLKMMPSLRTILIGCVDPRVDPERLLGVETGEVAVIRNVGGRVTPAVLDELAILRQVTQSAGADLGAGWEIVVLQHTGCGLTRIADRADLLAPFLGVDEEHLPQKAVSDPRAAVRHDLGVLGDETRLGEGVVVTGLVYDVATGLVEHVSI